MFRQGDSQMFKKYSQMKLQLKREALQKLNRQANEMTETLCQNSSAVDGSGTVPKLDRKLASGLGGTPSCALRGFSSSECPANARTCSPSVRNQADTSAISYKRTYRGSNYFAFQRMHTSDPNQTADATFIRSLHPQPESTVR